MAICKPKYKGEPSFLYEQLLKHHGGNEVDALQSYTKSKTVGFMSYAKSRGKYTNGEPSANVVIEYIDKYSPIVKYSRSNDRGRLDTESKMDASSNKLLFDEATHSYYKNNNGTRGAKAKGVSSTIEYMSKQGNWQSIKPFSGEDLKTALFNNFINKAHKTKGKDDDATAIAQYVGYGLDEGFVTAYFTTPTMELTFDQKMDVKRIIDARVDVLMTLNEAGTLVHQATEVIINNTRSTDGTGKMQPYLLDRAKQLAIDAMINSSYVDMLKDEDGNINDNLVNQIINTAVDTVNSIEDRYTSQGIKIRTEVAMVYDNADTGQFIPGTMDVIVIKENGHVDKYDLKASYKNKENWNKYKDVQIAYQQLMYRAILRSNGIRHDNTFIIPIKLDIDFSKTQSRNGRFTDVKLDAGNIYDLSKTTQWKQADLEVSTFMPTDLDEANIRIKDTSEVQSFASTFLGWRSDYDNLTEEELEYRANEHIQSGRSYIIDPDTNENIPIDPLDKDGLKEILRKKHLADIKLKREKLNTVIDLWQRMNLHIDETGDKNFKADPIIRNIVEYGGTYMDKIYNRYDQMIAYDREFKDKDDDIGKSRWSINFDQRTVDLGIIVFERKGVTNNSDTQRVIFNIVGKKLERPVKMKYTHANVSKLDKLTGRTNSKLGSKILAQWLTDEQVLFEQLGTKLMSNTVANVETLKTLLFILDNDNYFGNGKIDKIIHFSTTREGSTIPAMGIDRAIENLKLLVNNSQTKGKTIIENNSLEQKLRDFETTDQISETIQELDNYDRIIEYINYGFFSNISKNDKLKTERNIMNAIAEYVKEKYGKDLGYDRNPPKHLLQEFFREMKEGEITKLGLDAKEMLTDIRFKLRNRLPEEEKNMPEIINLLDKLILDANHLSTSFTDGDMIKYGFFLVESRSYMGNKMGSISHIVDQSIAPVITKVNQNIRSAYDRYLSKTSLRVKKEYLKSKGLWYGVDNVTNLGGFTQGAMENLFELDDDGVKTMNLRSNEDKTDGGKGQSYLTQEEKDMLKFMIDTFGSRRIPLMRPTFYSQATEGGFNPKEMVKEYWETLSSPSMQWANDVGFENKSKNMTEMYNIFDHFEKNLFQRTEAIQEQREKGNMSAFEQDLVFILDTYMLSKIRQEEVNKVLPVINAYQSTINELSYKYGIDMKNALDYIKSITIDKLFISRDIPKANEEVERTVQAVKQATFLSTIALSPMSAAKAIVNGAVLTNLSTIGESSSLKEFFGNFKLLQKALSAVMTQSASEKIGGKKALQLVSALNGHYGLNAMDSNQLAQTRTLHKHGIAQAENYLGINVSGPDYVFRMTMFVMKLMQDGAWKAHHFNNDTGLITYKAEEDGRYSEIFKDGKFIGVKKLTTQIRREQYALLQTQVKLLQEEVDGVTNGAYTEDGQNKVIVLPNRAYTNVERNSIKDKADKLFGNYGREERDLWANTISGSLLGQFRTWMKARVQRYVYLHNNQEHGLQGRFYSQEVAGEYMKDENGEIIMDENNQPIPLTITQWQGDYFEGMLQTVGWMLNDLATGRLLWKEEQYGGLPAHIKRAKIANLRKLLSEIIAFLIIYYGFPHLRRAVGEVQDNMGSKMGNTIEKMLVGGTSDLNLLTYVDPMNFNIPALSIVHNALKSAVDVTTGDSKFTDFMSNNVGVYRSVKDIYEAISSDPTELERATPSHRFK